MKKIVLAITGASGSIYGIKLMEALVAANHQVHLVVSSQGEKVVQYELESLENILGQYIDKDLIYHDNADLFSSIASGSFKTDGMIIAPCSMGTLGKIAYGISDSLLTRVSDVCIKEGRPLIMVTRETPLSPIHLENMLKLYRLGCTIFPPVPAFYTHPESLDTVIDQTVARILSLLDIQHPSYTSWGESYDQ
jgi:4-hydroxy-3-polyprenylbenzoate decarboxylase